MGRLLVDHSPIDLFDAYGSPRRTIRRPACLKPRPPEWSCCLRPAGNGSCARRAENPQGRVVARRRDFGYRRGMATMMTGSGPPSRSVAEPLP